MLEKEFEKDGIQVIWHDISAGTKQIQGMAASSLDASAAMNTISILLANAAGNEIKIASGVAHPAALFSIVGKPGKKMSIQDLKGKAVAGPKGTVLHALLLAALKKNGMKPDDVTFINMPIQKAFAALMGGAVDAALLVGSTARKAAQKGALTIATAEGLVTPNLIFSVRGKFADDYPEIVVRLVKVNRQALQWIKDHPDLAHEIGAREHSVTAKEAAEMAAESNYYDVLSKADIEGLKEDQKFLRKVGFIDKELNVERLVLPNALN